MESLSFPTRGQDPSVPATARLPSHHNNITPPSPPSLPLSLPLPLRCLQANTSLAYVADAIACGPVFSIYSATLSALCGDGIVASIKTWGLVRSPEP